ncbi:MAG: zinc protease [Bryobacterales bacterium]|jgi:zinc protease|nr:zinc protease [Bryobacterales bacterium]
MRTLLALLVSIPLVTQAQQAVPPASWKALKFPPLREIKIPKVEEVTLPNGMKVYLLEDRELPMVRGLALVRTGNLFDPADKVGLATITGDTIRSGGTTAKSGDQIDEELENIAASVESQIGESFGSISFSTLKERTDEVLNTFRDVLTAPAFREDKIELAKTSLRGGIARRNDDAHGISQREFTNITYGRNSPYGWDMQYATLDNIKRDDVVDFYKRYYFPANIILAVQGDFSAPEMKAKIEKLLGSWTYQQPPVPPFPKVNNSPKAGIYVATKTDVTQTNFALGHLGGELKDKDYPALEVMADILGGGFKSRLFQRVRTQLGYAYEVGADWGASYDHPGLFVISGSTKSASTADTLAAIQQEVQRIRTAPVTADELETAKQTVINSFVFNFETPSKTLNRLLTYRYFGYPDDFIFQYQKAVSTVTEGDILRVAKQYVDPTKFVIVATGNPKEFGKPLTSLNLPVSEINLTIPEPKAPKTVADAGSIARGKEILAKARQAMGGDKLASAKDLTQTATVQLDPAAGGLKVTQTEQWLAPGYFRQENVLPFGKVITYSDGKTGWSATPQGVAPAPEAQLRQIGFETFRMWFSLMQSDQNPERTVSGTGDGKVEISDKSGHAVTLTFDPGTGLPATQTYTPPANQNGAVEEVYSNWEETGGVKLPRKVTLNQGGKHFGDVTVLSATINQGLLVEQISKKP